MTQSAMDDHPHVETLEDVEIRERKNLRILTISMVGLTVYWIAGIIAYLATYGAADQSEFWDSLFCVSFIVALSLFTIVFLFVLTTKDKEFELENRR